MLIRYYYWASVWLPRLLARWPCYHQRNVVVEGHLMVVNVWSVDTTHNVVCCLCVFVRWYNLLSVHGPQLAREVLTSCGQIVGWSWWKPSHILHTSHISLFVYHIEGCHVRFCVSLMLTGKKHNTVTASICWQVGWLYWRSGSAHAASLSHSSLQRLWQTWTSTETASVSHILTTYLSTTRSSVEMGMIRLCLIVVVRWRRWFCVDRGPLCGSLSPLCHLEPLRVSIQLQVIQMADSVDNEHP